MKTEADQRFEDHIKQVHPMFNTVPYEAGFKAGYASAKLHSADKGTDEDMVEFAEWTQMNGWEYFKLYSGWKHFKIGHQDGVYKSTSDLLKLFREQKEKQKLK